MAGISSRGRKQGCFQPGPPAGAGRPSGLRGHSAGRRSNSDIVEKYTGLGNALGRSRASETEVKRTAGGLGRVPLLNLQRQLSRVNLLITDELGFEVFSQRYERGSILVTTNLPFDEWTEVFGSERLTGALLDRLTHHVHILEMNGDSYRLKRSRENAVSQSPDYSDDV